MLNRDVYLKDPAQIRLMNQGVANVNDDDTAHSLNVLKYELETFVCDGQYEKGINHIIETYLSNIGMSQQPSIWISGFYGSGKSHLVKMLRALWVDTKFPDGSKARDIANLNRDTKDLLIELSKQGKRWGGLHSASGTLGAGLSSNVRFALLSIIFRSCGLPEVYQRAQYLMWLKRMNYYDKVKNYIKQADSDWKSEINSFYLSDLLFQALNQIDPKKFSSFNQYTETMNNLFPHTNEISLDEMVNSIKQALSYNGEIPLTVIVLDEMQQYIGDNSERSRDVQETIEYCTKNIGWKLLFVATGQTAITGTPNLKKLEGRFTVRIELSDNDIDKVVRKVILQKSPSAIPHIEKFFNNNIGEISKHLQGTSLSHKTEDKECFLDDYPVLPVRRRFWECALKVLDQTGTDSQLRNQLSTVHRAIQTNLDRSLGNIIGADFIFFDSSEKMLQGRILSREIYEETQKLYNGDEDQKLLARACGIIFLINKITSYNNTTGIQAKADTIADLLIEDLMSQSDIRSRLPKLLDNCSLIMRVKDEYRIQTPESIEWNNDFQSKKNSLGSSPAIVESLREDKIKEYFQKETRCIRKK